MLENARRQSILVLLAIVAGIICMIRLDIPLGPDLKGGTQLLYNVPADVIEDLQKKENASKEEIMTQTIAVMGERIDPDGTLDPLITQSGDTGILIELPAFKSAQKLKRVLDRIGNLGKLEMRMVCYPDYQEENVRFNLQQEKSRLENWLKQPANRELIEKDPRNIRRFNEDPTGPIAQGNLAWYPREVLPNYEDPKLWDFSYLGSPKLEPATVRFYDDKQWNAGVIPEELLKKAEDPEQNYSPKLIEFVAINMFETAFTGEDLDPSGVGIGTGKNGRPGVNYRLVPDKQGDYMNWSIEHKGECSAIILNEFVKSAPVFQNKIPGSGIIEGQFTVAEVEELIKVLRTGSLRVEPELQSKMTIEANLGEAAVNNGLMSIIVGGLLVFLFMLAYYRIAGTIACASLLLNVFLLYAGMLFMQATITLPGLGGIVLTLGMAVDANVLIYERIREELQKGKEMLQAVRAGFERAMSAILDSNITTFLVGIVLFNVGVGPVRGFAVTMMVGIVTTVFTQFFVTRLLFHYAIAKGMLDSWQPRTLFDNRNVDFVGKIKVCAVLSAIVIIGGIGYATTVPFEKMASIDFTGGANLRMVMAEPTTAEDVRSKLGGDEEFLKAYPTYSVSATSGDRETVDNRQYNVRLKLNAKQRAEIEKARQAWREARAKAEAENLDPPEAYKPPYVAELERVFAGKLVDPAFSSSLLEEVPGQQNRQFAQLEVHFAQDVVTAELGDRLTRGLSGAKVTPLEEETAAQAQDFRIEWQTLASTRLWQLKDIVSKQLEEMQDASGELIALSDPFPDAQEIQGRLVDDLRNKAIGALLLAWVLIVFYLRVRFHEYKYGLAAVVALIHDVLVTFGVVVLCNNLGIVNAEISLAMIACFLTIIGYSVNDTIVVFDRIRENRIENAREGKDESFRSLINFSLNQTLSRTVLTTVLTLFVVIAQLVVNWGSGSELEGFAFAMTIGMCCGVYSTVFIAAPILIWMDKGGPVEIPEGPRDPEREGDFDNEAALAAEAEAAAAAEKQA